MGLGVDAQSRSPYIRARGQGEQAVREVFGGAIVIRPAVMFGLDDRFLNTLIKLLRRLPIYPMFGRGEETVTANQRGRRCRGGCDGDAADGDGRADGRMRRTRIYSYEELLRTIGRSANVKPILVPVPFAAWHGLAWIAEMLPAAPVTHSQVDLMQIDTVASPDQLGFTALGISPRPMEEALQNILKIV